MPKKVFVIPIGCFFIIVVLALSSIFSHRILTDIFGMKLDHPVLSKIKKGTIKPQTNIQYKYYTVGGNTAAKIREQIDLLGPKDPSGKDRGAFIRSEISFNLKKSQRRTGCYIENMWIKADLTYNMPKWEQPADVSPSVIASWDRFYKALELHEDIHKDMELKQVDEMFDALAKLPVYDKCEQLDTVPQALSEDMQAKYLQLQLQYDEETKHGLLQGAVLK